ncbi:Histidine kinase [Flexibacter flexilis DSM 6793]|uniref:Histidine kinase n=1 Tax=Flexibacter flexilis DSM 6793 TaxID=927664 RepID=A0A1I1JKM2_9BACT|nr:histidine kinase [Flexibacter flexilis]SFC49149.1 Histidine kinase [Flexibacter flexilis DSM 6793]
MQNSLSFNPYLNFLLHLLGWSLLGFMILLYIPLSWDVKLPYEFWAWQTLNLFVMVALFYGNAKIIVPQTIFKGKFSLFVGWIIAVLVLTQLLSYVYHSYTGLHAKMATVLYFKAKKATNFNQFVFTAMLLVLALSTSWAMLQHWQRTANYRQQLEHDKTMTELALLKTQINPHFFFNSLNSIYALTYLNVEDSRQALHTLSRMMRYLLYSTEDENTTLFKEVNFLKDYIALMRLRSTDKLKINTFIHENLQDMPIAPMLLLPFVENAFKHGVNATQTSSIDIQLYQRNEKLHFEVVNSIFVENNNNSETAEGGIGLTNTRRRLQLLYPNRHELAAGTNHAGKYEVSLQLDLV